MRKGPKVADAKTKKTKAKKTDAERLALLRQQEAALKARIARIEHKGKAQERKADTRLKIILGGAVLADAARHPDTAQVMEAVLARAVTSSRDKDFLAAMLAKHKPQG
jgi:hypothetical protein